MSSIVHNPLRATKFTLRISGDEYKDLVGAVTEYNHPGVRSNEAMQLGQKVDIPRAGNKIEYEPLVVRYILDSDMSLYSAVHDWLLYNVNEDEEKRQDLMLTLYNSNGVATQNIMYYNAFPVELGPIPFNSTDSNDTFMMIDTTFRYTHFEVKPV